MSDARPKDESLTHVLTVAARGKVPPHDREAEVSVLGAILLDNAALTAVEPILQDADFYVPAHGTIYGAMQELGARGEPVDVITLAEALRAQNRLNTVGGAQYLGELTDTVPSIAHVESHARIVAEMASLRRMIHVAEEIVSRGYTAPGKAQDFLGNAVAAVTEAAQGLDTSEPVPLEQAVLESFARLEATVQRGVRVTGVTTGFRDLDALTAGMHGGQLLIIAARPAMGKAQPVDTPVLTPDGWRPLGTIHVGDRVIGSQGKPVVVTGVFPQGVRPCFRVTASDGASTRCDAEHLWSVRTRNQEARGQPYQTFTLDALVTMGLDGGDRWHLPLVAPVQYAPGPTPPLGPEALADYLRTHQCREHDRDALAALGLADKPLSQGFLPEVFLRASVDVRTRLLDAFVRPDPRRPPSSVYEVTVFSFRLGRDLVALARSLGGVAHFAGDAQWTLQNGLTVVFRLPPPLGAPRSATHPTSGLTRTLARVEPCEEADMVCLAVDARDQRYVTEDFLVTHNTSFVLNVATAAAVATGQPVLFFSLEMPRVELTNRALCAAARVDQSRFRGALLTQDDLAALTAAANRICQFPVFIDDTGDLSLIELRAKARRMKQKRGLGLVVVDYLQLMRASRDRAESREREIADISRGLKALAKELDVPIVALSQLNRGCETRPGKNKRPMLADLRECLAGDQRVYDAATGLSVPIREVARRGPLSVLGLGEDLKVRPGTLVEAWSTGVRPVFALRTRSGRTLRATANHPLRTFRGWIPLGALRPGDRIAVPRVLPEAHDATRVLTRDEAVLLGLLISDGTYLRQRSVGYVKADPVLVREACRIVEARFALRAKNHRCPGRAVQVEFTTDGPRGPGSNPLIEWLRGLGIHGQKGHVKCVPDAVLRGNREIAAWFLGALWSGDGSVVRQGKKCALKFCSTSSALLDDLMILLGRFGIVAVRERPMRHTKSTRDIATVRITDPTHVAAFAAQIPLLGAKADRLRAAVATLGRADNTSVDRLPLEITDKVEAARKAAGLSHATLGYRTQGKKMSRAWLVRVAERLAHPELLALATSDVLWDEVVEVVPAGEEEVFDFRVPSLACAVVENIFVHNSGAIEQDADVVMFIYRDEVYNKDTEDRGVAEIILAKQRNGPTDTVRLRFIRALTLFEDLATDRPHDADCVDGAEFTDELPPDAYN